MASPFPEKGNLIYQKKKENMRDLSNPKSLLQGENQ